MTTVRPTVSVMTTLERAKICEGLDPGLVEILSSAFKVVEFNAGFSFIEHDSQSKDIYIIAKGLVEIEIPVVGKAANSSLARLKVGESVGEFALLRDARRSASAKAVGDLTMIVASSAQVLALFESYPAMGYCVCRNLGRILADRLNDTNMQLRSELSRG